MSWLNCSLTLTLTVATGGCAFFADGAPPSPVQPAQDAADAEDPDGLPADPSGDGGAQVDTLTDASRVQDAGAADVSVDVSVDAPGPADTLDAVEDVSEPEDVTVVYDAWGGDADAVEDSYSCTPDADVYGPGDGGSNDGGQSDAAQDGAADVSSDATATGVTCDLGSEQVPPVGLPKILPWLNAGKYLGWKAEATIHKSKGPHSFVRIFVNDAMADSLWQQKFPFKPCASSVKEVYEADGKTLRGWAVMTKLKPESGTDGLGWYWMETNTKDGSAGVLTDGPPTAKCLKCHLKTQQDLIKTKAFNPPAP